MVFSHLHKNKYFRKLFFFFIRMWPLSRWFRLDFTLLQGTIRSGDTDQKVALVEAVPLRFYGPSRDHLFRSYRPKGGPRRGGSIEILRSFKGTSVQELWTKRWPSSRWFRCYFTVLQGTIRSGVIDQKVALVEVVPLRFYCPSRDHPFRSYRPKGGPRRGGSVEILLSLI